MMNVKKQLRKIRDYVEALEISEDKTTQELRKYELTAYKFVNFELSESTARFEFKELLGDTTFIGGCFAMGSFEYENIQLREENARLREELAIYEKTRSIQAYKDLVDKIEKLQDQLRWYSIAELPTLDHSCISKWSKTVVFQVNKINDPELAFYDYHDCCWKNIKTMEKIKTFPNSHWCYIPEGGE